MTVFCRSLSPRFQNASQKLWYNSTSGLPLFGRIKQMRLLFVKSIVKNDKSQQENLRGWERRINSIMYDNLILNKND